MPANEGQLDNKKSPFKTTICREDLRHIKTIKETDVGATSLKRLTEIFYQTVMKPVQGHINFELTQLLYHKLHFKNFKIVRFIRSRSAMGGLKNMLKQF